MDKESKRKGVNGKQKGKNFENLMAKRFSEWLGFPVRSTPGSGSYGSEWNMGGDLMFKRPVIFHVELKKREAWRFDHVYEFRGEPVKWWEQATREAEKANQIPILIAAKNHVHPILIHDIGLAEAWWGKVEDLPWRLYVRDRWCIVPVESLFKLDPGAFIK